MPQMSPLNWLNLMMIFIITLTTFTTMNYFNLLYKSKKISWKKTLKQINWKL